MYQPGRGIELSNKLSGRATRCLVTLGVVATLVACNEHGTIRADAPASHAATMARIEREVVLPAGSEPLDHYARYYADGPDGQVLGTFVAGDDRPIGQSRWVPAKDLPMIDDGGCFVVSLVYDPRRGRVTEIGCNGPPPPDGLQPYHPS